MDDSQRNQSALLDAIYGAAIEPGQYLEFAKIWDSTILKSVEGDEDSSLRTQADELELRKHFNRAFEVFEKSRHGQRQSLQSFLDTQAFAGALCQSDGKIVACNSAFTAQFGLEVKDDLSALTDKVQPLVGLKTQANSGKWLLVEDQQTAYRFYDDNGSHSLLLLERFDQDSDGKPVANPMFLVRSSKLEWSPKVGEFLATSFGLTASEIEIAQQILLGMRSGEIAESRKRSKGTVRQQIKSIMDKTEASTQATLTGLLVSLHHLFASRPSTEPKRKIHHQSAGKIHETVIAEAPLWGTIEYECFGAMSGKPIFFLHSQMSVAKPWPAMFDAMANAGLLVFAPRKPGLAATALERQKTDPVGFVSAFIELMKDNGVQFEALVGQGMSGVAMIDYVAQNPDFGGRLVTIDSGIPFTRREQFEHMLPVSKRIFWTVWDCPELFYAPFAFASEALFASDAGEAAFMHDQFKDIPHDHALIEDSEFYRLANQAMRDFMSTPRRSADELVYWMQDWTGALETVASRMPILFLQSEFHDFLRLPDTTEYLDALPKIKAVLLEDTAQLCVIERPELIAQHIAAHIASNAARKANRLGDHSS